MIEIFQNLKEISVGITKPPQWQYISTGIKENISKLENYYRTNVRPVRSDHFLVRLLQSIPVSKSLELRKYFDSVDSISMNHSMVHKLTSNYYIGSIHRGVFYGGVIPEIILATDESFNIEEVNNNWKDVRAVKTLIHPKSDFSFNIPNGKDYSDEYGLAIISININMLAVQYRAFFNNELKLRPDSPYSTSYFISAYVLPNMIRDDIEITLFNRLFNMISGIENYPVSFKHPISLPNYLPYVDKALEMVKTYIEKSDKSYRRIFSSIPSIYKDNFTDILLLPNIFENRQVSWVLILARLKMITFLIKVSGEEAYIRNNNLLTQTVRTLNRFNSINVISEELPIDIYFDIEADIELLLQTLNKNFIK